MSPDEQERREAERHMEWLRKRDKRDLVEILLTLACAAGIVGYTIYGLYVMML